MVHVHLRDEQERPTADLRLARRVVGLIEEACPALIQLSTGVGLGVPFRARAARRGAGNGELVGRLAEVARALDGPSADVAQTRRRLGLPG